MTHVELIQKLNPNADALLIAVSSIVDDELLTSIANNDYGMSVDEHYAQLRKIRDEQIVLAPILWEPKEVLELERWSRPTTQPGHIARAFSCAALLRAMAHPDNAGYFDGDNQTIAVLLESLPHLEQSIQHEALRFFAWRVQDLSQSYGEAPFYLLALLILVLRTQFPLTHTEMREVIDWIYNEVYSVPNASQVSTDMEFYWLRWVSYFGSRYDIWQSLSLEMTVLAEQRESIEESQSLKELALHIEEA
jgi:hypothetical protein